MQKQKYRQKSHIREVLEMAETAKTVPQLSATVLTCGNAAPTVPRNCAPTVCAARNCAPPAGTP